MTKILIVDDMREVHEQFINCPANHIYSKDYAIQIINSTFYDLIITDYHLSDEAPLGGLSVARTAKEKGLPVILMSTENHIKEAQDLNITFVFKNELFEYLKSNR